jgi:RHS repeat-associated protein
VAQEAPTPHESPAAQAHIYAYQHDAYGNLTGRAESAQQDDSLYTYLTTDCGVDRSTATDYVRNLCFTSTVTTGAQGVSNRLGTVSRGGTLTVNGTLYGTGIASTAQAVQYSGNGNVTDDGTYLYGYDPLNRLVTVRVKSSNVLQFQYFYDASGERSAAIAYNGTGTATGYTQYLRDGAQVVYEKTWSLPGYTVTQEKAYITAQGKLAVTKQTVSGTTTYTYYGTDHLGTVRATLTVNTSGVEQYRTIHDYEPYGQEIVPRDTVSPNTHRYTGHERDVLNPSAGSFYSLDYMHYRSYAGNMGRFFAPDNKTGNPLNPQNWNLYSYVRGNPVNFNDPTGHAAQQATGDDSTKKKGWWASLWDSFKSGCENLWDKTFGVPDDKSSDKSNQTKELEDQGVINEGEGGQTDVGKKANADLKEAAATGATEVTKQVVIYAATEGVGKVVEGVANLKRLTPGEIKVLKAADLDPHELKKEFGKGIDIFKDSKGNLLAAPMSGKGAAEPLNINIKDLP